MQKVSKIFLLTFVFLSFLKANYEIIESENLFVVKVDKVNFDEKLLSLKDEINFESFTIVYELNLAKATNEVAVLLEKKGV